MFVRSRPSRTRWAISPSWARSDTIGEDDEVDRQAVCGPRLRRAGDGHQRSSSSNDTRGPLLDVTAEDVEHQVDHVSARTRTGGDRAREFGIDWDISYVVAAEAGRGDPPPDALNPDRRLMSWAIDRAHWLAGWYVALSGRRRLRSTSPRGSNA
jgi:hypothetical protein